MAVYRGVRDVREQAKRGHDVRARPIAEALSISYSGIYGMIARGEIESRRIGEAVIIPNREARRLLGIDQEAVADGG